MYYPLYRVKFYFVVAAMFSQKTLTAIVFAYFTVIRSEGKLDLKTLD